MRPESPLFTLSKRKKTAATEGGKEKKAGKNDLRLFVAIVKLSNA